MATRLSESLVWAQSGVYESLGMRAWSEGLVPWRATTCPLLADVEAELIVAFAADVRQPVTVIDAGAGTGRLSFHLARALSGRGVAVRLVVTDVASSNVEALAAQPQLAELAKEGLLTFAHFDALAPARLADGPTVVLAHYLFDTLPHAAFRRRGTAGFEGFVDTNVEPWHWHFEPAELPGCLDGRGEGTFLVPVGAARALARMREMFEGPLLVLAADKGVLPRSADELPLIARHGSVSAGVDFEALRAMVEPAWRVLAPKEPSPVFGLYAYLSGADSPALTDAWFRRGTLNEVPGLLEDFEVLLRSDADAPALLAFVRRTCGDPDLLAQLCGRFRSIPLTDSEARELIAHLAEAGSRHFLFRQQIDVPFELAITAHHLGALELASALYTLSLRESGPHPSTLFNLALVHDAVGRRELAREALTVLLAQTPGHARAETLLAEWLKDASG